MGIEFERFYHTVEAAVMAASVWSLGEGHGWPSRMSENSIPMCPVFYTKIIFIKALML